MWLSIYPILSDEYKQHFFSINNLDAGAGLSFQQLSQVKVTQTKKYWFRKTVVAKIAFVERYL